jgi:ABC-type dipeptide/oligopeptide/nickel transport system permease component
MLFAVLVLSFALFHVVGGDPARVKAGKKATPEKLAEIRKELGTDRPILEQFGDYLKGAVTFDLGARGTRNARSRR